MGMVGIGADARVTTLPPAALASPDRKRAAGASPSPLKPLPARVKDAREDSNARECEQLVASEAEQRHYQRTLRFHGRWPAVRAFYAAVAESVPLAKRKVWLRLVAARLHDAIVGTSAASLAQTESAVTTALRPLVTSPWAWNEVLQALRAAVAAFNRDDAPTFDYRELLCACIVLDRWQDGELRLLSLWMDEYSLPVPPAGDMAVLATDISHMIMTPCAGSVDEQAMAPHVAQLLAAVPAVRGWIRVTQIKSFVERCAPLRGLLKACCWRRLMDDMRLGFFRDVYRQAMERVEHEEANCRLAAAMQLWQLREPRARLARWKDFVHVRKLMRRGDGHFYSVSQRKFVSSFRQHRARRQQLRRWLEDARAVHEASLVRWTLHAWRLYLVSMVEIHRAAWNRSVRHHALSLRERIWKAYAEFVEVSRAERARRQTLLDQFIARRHLKVLRFSWGEWMFVYRRQKEVRVAMQLERQLHGDIEAQRREEAEQACMVIEDALSQAVELRQRQLEELARQRAFQEATNRVYANRKLKKQEEERTAFKRAREERALAEMDEAWDRISERVATEVRATTLTWFRSSEGHKAVEAEATEIFERDPVMIQKALIQDPQAFALPGCRWQLRLEDYGGRLAKPFFINTETLEKFVCDELVMENCEAIAKEVLIQRRIDDARARLRAKAGDVERERQRHEAAIRIQMLFRCRHALLIARSKIRTSFVKRIEPTTGDVVYFNIPKQATRRKPPRLIGSDEPLIPVESSTWVRRLDDDGNNYYLHQETGETSWTPPAHHFTCVKCKFSLATRRWNETGARFCIACYADGLQRKLFGVGATWTKLTVQPAKCVVCRSSPAEVVCHECKGDATCARCCQAVHRSPKLAAHRDMAYLVYT